MNPALVACLSFAMNWSALALGKLTESAQVVLFRVLYSVGCSGSKTNHRKGEKYLAVKYERKLGFVMPISGFLRQHLGNKHNPSTWKMKSWISCDHDRS